MRTFTKISAVLLAAALAGWAATAALGVTGGGATPKTEFRASDTRTETPSGAFITIESMTFAAQSGPVVVRYSATGYVQDRAKSGSFVGKSFTCTYVRILLNGAVVDPGPVTFFDNTGKVGLDQWKYPRPTTASFTWVGTLAAPATVKVDVQVRAKASWDPTTILRDSLVVDHA